MIPEGIHIETLIFIIYIICTIYRIYIETHIFVSSHPSSSPPQDLNFNLTLLASSPRDDTIELACDIQGRLSQDGWVQMPVSSLED